MTPAIDLMGASLDVLTMKTAPQPKRRNRRLSAIIRVSKRQGREGDSFMSPEQQKDLIIADALRKGDEIVSWWDETDSVSGGTVDPTKRHGLKGAWHEVMTGFSDGVIVAKVNRFARTKRAGEALIYDLIEAGKSFIAVFNNIDTAGGKLDRGSEVYLDFLLRQAQWEREDLKANWEDVRHRHVAAGVAVRPCYGYTKATKDAGRRLVPNKRQALWVVRMFEWRAAGWSWNRITAELNRRNVTPPQPHSPKVQPSTAWVPQHVTRIVNNRTYLGELHRGKECVNLAAHEPIITIDLWEAAHAVRIVGAQDTKADASYFVLRGLVRCASCGGRMTGVTHTARGARRRYYRCRKLYPWGRCPKPAFVSADDLEAAVFTDFERRAIGKVRAKSKAHNAALITASAAVDQARAEWREYNRVTAAARSEFGEDDFAEGTAVRQEAVRVALAEESRARAAVIGVSMPATLEEDWPTMEPAGRAVLLSRFYHCVAVGPTSVHKANEPAAERMRLWVIGDSDAPQGLPGRTIGKRRGAAEPNEIRKINLA